MYPWLKKPGEVFDSKGIPIYQGDLLKSFHFIGARKKRHYLYHVAVLEHGGLWMVPTCHLEPSKVSGGGRCHLSEDMASNTEIITGHGPDKILSFEDRPRRKTAPNQKGPSQ